jgi:hypothetical protein
LVLVTIGHAIARLSSHDGPAIRKEDHPK